MRIVSIQASFRRIHDFLRCCLRLQGRQGALPQALQVLIPTSEIMLGLIFGRGCALSESAGGGVLLPRREQLGKHAFQRPFRNGLLPDNLFRWCERKR